MERDAGRDAELDQRLSERADVLHGPAAQLLLLHGARLASLGLLVSTLISLS